MNFILTVIAVLLLVIALRAPVGLASELPAQSAPQPDRDPQSAALREIASSLRGVASSIDGVADSNRRIAEAITSLELQVDVHPE